MASSLRRGSAAASFLRSNAPAGAEPASGYSPARVSRPRGANSNLLSSAQAPLQSALTTIGPAVSPNLYVVLMYYVLGFPELVAPATAGAPPLPAQPLLLLRAG